MTCRLDSEVEAHAEAARVRGIDETDPKSPTAGLTIEVLRSAARRGKAALLLLLLLLVAMPPLVTADGAMPNRSMLVAD